MKMSKEDYKGLAECLDAVDLDSNVRSLVIKRANIRELWTLFHKANAVSGHTLVGRLYASYNDSHIETALKRYQREA